MENTQKIITLEMPAKYLRAPGLFRVGAILFRKALSNENNDDDPPPSASATVRAFPPPKQCEYSNSLIPAMCSC
jgi:hypothetical protein